MITHDEVLRLDRDDPLRDFRDEFELPGDVIYLDGNSLGALPKATKARIAGVISEEWGKDLIKSWNVHDWIGLPQRVGAKIAKLIGAMPDEVIAADSTSVNLFKLLAAAIRLQPGRRVVLSEPGNFPTDIYMVQGLADLLGGKVELRLVEREKLSGALNADVAVLLLTHSHYKSGRIHDMKGLSAAARAVGALSLWDLSHSAGAMELHLNRDGADLAVGCGYKFLNGGPGAPAFLFVPRRLQNEMRQPLSGWMGHAAPFDFSDEYRPASGVTRQLCGTPAVLSLAALEVGIDVMLKASMADVRRKGQKLGDLFLTLVDEMCPGMFRVACPRNAEERGSQVGLGHGDGYAIMQALIARGVIGDFREPDIIRFGFAPLYTRYDEVWQAVKILKDIMDSGQYREARFQVRAAVT
jgi:kynureninase